MTIWQTKMISVRLLAVLFGLFIIKNEYIFTSCVQDRCCYSSKDVCCRVFGKLSEIVGVLLFAVDVNIRVKL